MSKPKNQKQKNNQWYLLIPTVGALILFALLAFGRIQEQKEYEVSIQPTPTPIVTTMNVYSKDIAGFVGTCGGGESPWYAEYEIGNISPGYAEIDDEVWRTGYPLFVSTECGILKFGHMSVEKDLDGQLFVQFTTTSQPAPAGPQEMLEALPQDQEEYIDIKPFRQQDKFEYSRACGGNRIESKYLINVEVQTDKIVVNQEGRIHEMQNGEQFLVYESCGDTVAIGKVEISYNNAWLIVYQQAKKVN